jgi:diamine N-acetyltransferase
MEHLDIYPIGPSDVGQLQEIGRLTFFETFAEHNTAENIQKYLVEGFSLEKLTAELHHPDARFYFAALDGEVIGYLKLNFGPAQTELQDNNALEIERIYVKKSFHGQKVGQMLYEKAIQVAREAGVQYVWLGVWENNKRALQFYQKNGFVVFDTHLFHLGEEEQTDFMMRLDL